MNVYLSEKVNSKKIEETIRSEAREIKNSRFKEISSRLVICDNCPLLDEVASVAKSDGDLTYDQICGDCDNYNEIRKIGDELWNQNTNFEVLLVKGKEMTVEEIIYLLENGATKKEIQLALGFTNPKQLNAYLKEILNPINFAK